MKNLLKYFFFLFVILFGCSTEPGSTGTVAGSSICRYEDCDFDVVLGYDPNSRGNITSAVVAFAPNSVTGARQMATELDTGVTITWPSNITFTLPNGCTVQPTKISSTEYTLYKIFVHSYPTSCTPSTTVPISGTGAVTISKNGSSRTVNGSGSGGGGGGSPSISYHTVFVTSGTYRGDFGGLSAADTICQTRAAAGTLTSSLTGTWRAILSDSTHSAAGRLNLYEIPIKNVNSDTIASSPSGLWDGTLDDDILYTENGFPIGGGVWTSTQTNGSSNGAGCSDWSCTSGCFSTVGDPTKTNSTWIFKAVAIECDSYESLYCINAVN